MCVIFFLRALRVFISHLLGLTRRCLVCSRPSLQPRLRATFPSFTLSQSHWSSGYSKITPSSFPTQGLGVAFASIWKAFHRLFICCCFPPPSHPPGFKLYVREVSPDCSLTIISFLVHNHTRLFPS